MSPKRTGLRQPPPRPPERRAARRQVERQRQRDLRRARHQREATRRRRRTNVLRATALVIGAAIVGFSAWAPARPKPVVFIEAATPIDAYTIVYRNELSGVTNTETTTVRRPFLGASIGSRDGETNQAQLTNDKGLWSYSTGSNRGWFSLDGRPHRSAGDLKPTSGLNEAIRMGMARVLGTDRVLGRPCTLVRTGEPIGQPVKKPTDGDRAEICIDRTGVVLRQDWWLRNKLVQHEVATSFEIGVADEKAFVPEPVADIPAEALGQANVVTRLSDDDRAKLRPVVNAPPGFRYERGDTLLRQATQFDPGGRSEVLQFLRPTDHEIIEVEHKTVEDPQGSRKGVVVDVPKGFSGHLEVSAGLSVLTVRRGNDFLVMRSSDVDALKAAARLVRR